VTLAIVLGIHVHFALSIIISLLFFVGLVFLIFRVKRLNAVIHKKIHFNLSLILRNENEKVFSKFSIKARPGYLSKWIEFHWANPYGQAIP
jgi:hypothetical protein